MLRELRFAIDQLAVESRQRNNPKVVLVSRTCNLISNGNCAEQLLLNLTFKSLSRSLARFNLAAWELPHASEAASQATLRA